MAPEDFTCMTRHYQVDKEACRECGQVVLKKNRRRHMFRKHFGAKWRAAKDRDTTPYPRRRRRLLRNDRKPFGPRITFLECETKETPATPEYTESAESPESSEPSESSESPESTESLSESYTDSQISEEPIQITSIEEVYYSKTRRATMAAVTST
jgi:hypothetical protein